MASVVTVRRLRLPLLFGLCLLALAGPARAASITEFPLFIAGSGPMGIAAGSDGNVWFTEHDGSRVGKITPGGRIDDYSTGSGISAGSKPNGIVSGPDGNLWFTEQSGGRIGRITPAGTATEFTNSLNSNSGPLEIANGPDGNLWFTEQSEHVARIRPTGEVTGVFNAGFSPTAIAAGPDGKLWFTIQAVGIGTVTTDGVVSGYTDGITAGTKSNGIVAGPDGNLWFTETSTDKIGRITPTGVVTEFSNGISANALPYEITVGPDGNLWFTELAGRIGRITPAGVVTEYSSGITAGSQPEGIVTGPDGNLWFTEYSGNRIGRLKLDPAVLTGAASSIGTAAATLNGTVNRLGSATSYTFEYGLTAGYTDNTAPKTVPSVSGATPVSADIGGLDHNTLYHYRLVATSAAGTGFGGDHTFTTTNSGSIGGGGAGGGGSPSTDKSGPAVRVLTRALTSSHKGLVRISLRCPLTETLGCRGTVTLDTVAKLAGHGRSVARLGRTRFRIGGGQTRTITVRLSSRARRLLRRHHRLSAKALISATDSAHNHRSTSRRLTLRD